MILGKSRAIEAVNQLIRQVAPAKTNILICGESGTGKELVARQIHEGGALKDFPFVPINCGAIPENLIESELFGHQRGSFTGATSDKAGLFEVANRGTLFLDEVGELPLGMQVKLLRVLQERAFRRVGGLQDVKVDVRIIAATNVDLEKAVKQGSFREDLFYRLNVIMIRTPALRERKEDIPLLAEHFLKKYSTRAQKKLMGIHPDVYQALQLYSWPGNVRELENCFERAVTMETADQVTLDSLPEHLQKYLLHSESAQSIERRSQPSGFDRRAKKGGAQSPLPGTEPAPSPDFAQGKVDLEKILDGIERSFLVAALDQAKGVKAKAAKLLGLSLRSFRYRAAKFKLGGEGEED